MPPAWLPSISIHAPAGGATQKLRDIFVAGTISIHAPAGGATDGLRLHRSAYLFQFTPLREGRPRRCRRMLQASNFNSRPCGRGDLGNGGIISASNLFQFTPLREGRPTPTRPESLLTNFNSRPCGRGDAVFQIIARRDFYFNSRPCGRGDRKRLQSFPQQLLFQFTPLREGRPAALMSAVWMIFQFTPLREGRRDYRTTIAGARLFQFTPLREGRRPGDV